MLRIGGEPLKGKTALITGGSSGIGKATCIAFGREGANVIVVSRTESSGKATEAELRDLGVEAKWLQADVSNPEDIKKVMEEAKSLYGTIDYAFNNAASSAKSGMLTEIKEEEWESAISGILTSTFLCMKYELIIMEEQGFGAIVNNASVDGLRGFPMDPVYSAAKHGVIGLTKSTALQYAKKGIRINAICPSWTFTPRIERLLQRSPGKDKEWLEHQPIGRLGKPEEIAEAVLWLCSDKASFVLGTALSIDGGYTAM